MSMNKKIWIMGRTYDLNTMSVPEIEDDIKARLKDYSGVEVGLKINVKANSIETTFHRSLNVPVEPDTILEADTLLITGEGYQGLNLPYGTNVPHFPNMIIHLDKKDFCKEYKKNAIHFGASRMKNVKVEEYVTSLCLIINF